jgi:hypothetical protein
VIRILVALSIVLTIFYINVYSWIEEEISGTSVGKDFTTNVKVSTSLYVTGDTGFEDNVRISSSIQISGTLCISGDMFQLKTSSGISKILSPGVKGDIRIGEVNGIWYIFVATGTNAWGRATLGTW